MQPLTNQCRTLERQFWIPLTQPHVFAPVHLCVRACIYTQARARAQAVRTGEQGKHGTCGGPPGRAAEAAAERATRACASMWCTPTTATPAPAATRIAFLTPTCAPSLPPSPCASLRRALLLPRPGTAQSTNRCCADNGDVLWSEGCRQLWHSDWSALSEGARHTDRAASCMKAPPCSWHLISTVITTARASCLCCLLTDRSIFSRFQCQWFQLD